MLGIYIKKHTLKKHTSKRAHPQGFTLEALKVYSMKVTGLERDLLVSLTWRFM